jgi:D-alanyl-D-alanine carboxypeptidase (penicillin-binding protein 5/6)
MRLVQVTPHKHRRKRKLLRKLLLLLPGLLLLAGLTNYFRPIPAPTAKLTLLHLPAATTPAVAWPSLGQATVSSTDYGLLGAHGNQNITATASIAKVIVSLCVLQKYPLSIGQQGPILTIGDADIEFYNNALAQDGSLVAVRLGEKITEYQALQALLLPSANNMAESLVLWAFGSQAAYATYANQFLLQSGLANTHIGKDASGFDASTVSTATDLAQLGLKALLSPVLMEIAGQKTAELPVEGTVYNYNAVLGISGITGLKTGNNEADPGAFLFTAGVPVGTTIVPIAGAVMDAPDLRQALNDATSITSSLGQAFEQVSIATAGQTVGEVRTAWGSKVPIEVSQSLRITRWKGTALSAHHSIHTTGLTKDRTVGAVEITAGKNRASSTLKLTHTLSKPGFWWRLTRH